MSPQERLAPPGGVRQSVNGILIASSPAEIGSVPATQSLRLRNDGNGRGPAKLGTALASGRQHAIGMDRLTPA
ncbi:hypothetical protein [Streptomyces fulvorobeus]|nr:hypothetical protein [Streptomyces fulvorobeus]NYE44539.1 hypothetical protein [Streptomyces fulvorobeus]